MNIVFMGTPDFARRPLEYLHEQSAHDVVGVVTGPDKGSGRGRTVKPTPVKRAAEAFGLPVLTPESLKDASLTEELRAFDADIFVVVAFRILPERIFAIPPHGTINLHGSLLPKYRGAAPIQWALINGETDTGLTTFQLKKKVDTGDMLLQETIAIEPDDTYDDLAERMSHRAGPLLARTLDLIAAGTAVVRAQNNALASPAPKINPEDGLIDWHVSSRQAVNFIRGLSSIPGAFTTFHGRKLKILRARQADDATSDQSRPGAILDDPKRLMVACREGAIEIMEVVPEGKSRMSGEAFRRGYRPDTGDVLGEKITGNDLT